VRERRHHDGELVLREARRLRRRLTDDLRHAMVVTSWSLRRRRPRRRCASLLATVPRSRRRASASASASARMIHACLLSPAVRARRHPQKRQVPVDGYARCVPRLASRCLLIVAEARTIRMGLTCYK
jgi:hypothetical protein